MGSGLRGAQVFGGLRSHCVVLLFQGFEVWHLGQRGKVGQLQP